MLIVRPPSIASMSNVTQRRLAGAQRPSEGCESLMLGEFGRDPNPFQSASTGKPATGGVTVNDLEMRRVIHWKKPDQSRISEGSSAQLPCTAVQEQVGSVKLQLRAVQMFFGL